MPQLHETVRGQRFYDVLVPNIFKTLQGIHQELQRSNDLKEKSLLVVNNSQKIEQVSGEKTECQCPFCNAEMEYKKVKGCHFHVCTECPNISFEFIDISDVNDLADYLSGKKKDVLTELYEYIGLDSKQYEDNTQLLHEIKLLEKNGEDPLGNFAIENDYTEEEIEYFMKTIK